MLRAGGDAVDQSRAQRLTEGTAYAEWDHTRGEYREGWTTVFDVSEATWDSHHVSATSWWPGTRLSGWWPPFRLTLVCD